MQVDGIDESESEDDDALDDSDCIDDEVLRSVDAFSSSDEEQDKDLNVDLLAQSLASGGVTYEVISDASGNIGAPIQRSQKSVASAVRLLKSIGGPASSHMSKLSKVSRAEVKLIEAKAASADAPMQGTLLYILYTVLYSCGFLCATYLYDRNVDLVPFQMLIMRSVFAIGCQIIIYNKALKPAVWDGVDRASSGPLLYRSMQGCISSVINFSAAACIPLTMIAIINNMSPLVTVVLAFFILKEPIKCFEILMIVLLVSGILVVVLFSDDETSSSSSGFSPTIIHII